MIGLLLKEFYQLLKYYKVILLMAVLFLIIVAINGINFFAIVYLSAVGGVIPMTLLSYDEHSGWDIYARTLPYTTVQLVSVKYIIGLLFDIVILVSLLLIMLFAKCSVGDMIISSSLILMFSMLVTALTAPLSFKFGTAKGKVLYGALFWACVVIVIAIFGTLDAWGIWIGTLTLMTAVGAVMIIYSLSWLLSVRFYKNRQF